MTLLIKNVQVLGSPYKLPPKIDIFISGEKISAFGNFPSRGADEIIDGQGAYLSPGFIDVNTDSDHCLTIFSDPGQEDFLKQGATTIIGGHCGASLAPLLYGSLESIRKWADIDKINVNWHTMKEFLSVLEKRRLAVNFGTLIGHSTIRRDLIGESSRNLTKNELKIFSKILKQALAEGGLGLSTGLGYAHGRETSESEIKFLAKLVKNYGGVYATHLRKSGSELLESADETIKLSNETSVKVLLSHFLPHFGEENLYQQALEKFDRLPADRDFHFDLYLDDAILIPLHTFLPIWAQKDNWETMNALLEDEWQRTKIEKDFPPIQSENFIVSRAPRNESLVGHSLAELKELYGSEGTAEALSRLMRSTKLRAVIHYRNINRELVEAALRHSRSLVASNAASFPDNPKERIFKPERAFSTFTKFLELIQRESLMPLEEAIKKITLEPAKKFNLRGRGEIREGNFADLVVFRNNKANPHTKNFGVEIKFVVVNGRVAVKDGVPQNIFNGKILKRA